MSKLRESARDAPRCFGCGLENPNRDMLCLAHLNEVALGRGAYFKTEDMLGAILCPNCHDHVDGRKGGWTLTEKRLYHLRAHCKTLLWWINIGLVSVAGKGYAGR